MPVDDEFLKQVKEKFPASFQAPPSSPPEEATLDDQRAIMINTDGAGLFQHDIVLRDQLNNISVIRLSRRGLDFDTFLRAKPSYVLLKGRVYSIQTTGWYVSEDNKLILVLDTIVLPESPENKGPKCPSDFSRQVSEAYGLIDNAESIRAEVEDGHVSSS